MRAIATLLAVALLGTTLTAQAQPVAPQPFVATYDVSYRGIGAGNLIFKLAREPATGRYVYETRANPSMLARMVIGRAALERTVMEIGSQAGTQAVRPIEWQLDDGKSGAKGDGKLQFDWTRGAASGEIEGEKIDLTLEPGVQDRLSIQIAVVTALMRGQEPGTIPLIDDNRVKRYTYTRKEAASVDSPLGRLDAVIYESTREGSSRVSRFWLVPSLEFVAVRAEQIRKGKVETVMVLTALERAGQPQGGAR